MKFEDKPLMAKLVETTVLTLVPSCATALLLIIWHLYTDLDDVVRDNQKDIRATSEVLKEDISMLKAKLTIYENSQSKIWEQINELRNDIVQLEKDHLGMSIGPMPPSKPKDPKPVIIPNQSEIASQILQQVQMEQRAAEWRIQQEKGK